MNTGTHFETGCTQIHTDTLTPFLALLHFVWVPASIIQEVICKGCHCESRFAGLAMTIA